MKRVFLVIAMMLLFNTCSFAASPCPEIGKNTYEKCSEFDLSQSGISIVNGEICYAPSSTTGRKNAKNIKKAIDASGATQSIISEAILSGEEPIQLITKEVYVERACDSDGSVVSDRLLTNSEVEAIKRDATSKTMILTSSNAKTYKSGRLTIGILVTKKTSASDGLLRYKLRAVGEWDITGTFLYNTKNSPGFGKDFIALGWNSKFTTESDPSAYSLISDLKYDCPDPVVTQISENSGMCWSFDDNFMCCGASAAVTVRSNSKTTSYTAFSVSYGHTWMTLAYSASLGGGAPAIVSVSPSLGQWTIATSVSSYF